MLTDVIWVLLLYSVASASKTVVYNGCSFMVPGSVGQNENPANGAMITIMILSLLLSSVVSASKIVVYNKCPFTIWPGTQGNNGNPANGGFQLNAGERRTLDVPDHWTSGRIWARTGCDANFDCETGSCENKLECAGTGGKPPVTLAEFTLADAGGIDNYDVSLVDGYNIPALIELIEGTFNSDGGGTCQRAGGCVQNPNDDCPDELAVRGRSGNTVACKSACLKFRTDQYCCLGYFNDPNRCHYYNWLNPNYYFLFKNACPGAYCYAYDEPSGALKTCRGKNRRAADYIVQFC